MMVVLCYSEVPVFVVRLRNRNAQCSGRDEYDPDEQVFHDDAPYVSPLVSGMETSYESRVSPDEPLVLHEKYFLGI
ncbi:MAG: hypothetical protein EoVTN8_148 [Fluviibacter phosphoraccumulans EoVTN8]